MIAGVLVFAAACIVCAEANGLSTLIAGRVLQGLAGAVVVAASLELLLRLDPEGAVGTWATAGVIGAAVGPAAGGVLTDLLSWEAMFALQAPVALVALAGVVGMPATARSTAPGERRRRPARASPRWLPSRWRRPRSPPRCSCS